MNNSHLGIRVFPTESSAAVLRSNRLLHFSPVPEPSIDYTIKEKSRKRPDYSVTHDVFRKDPSPDYEHEEDALRGIKTSAQRPRRIDRRSTQVVGDVLHGRSEMDDPDKILNDLNITLEKEERSINRLENTQRRKSLERTKSFAEKGQQAHIAPILKTEVIEDLSLIAQGQKVADVNEIRKQKVLDMYEKTRRLVENARNTYTIEYFIPQYADRPIPQWQQQLLASKASKEMVRKYEEKVWDEFDIWKRRYSPQTRLPVDYQLSTRPYLN